jgi:hypothetical protein
MKFEAGCFAVKDALGVDARSPPCKSELGDSLVCNKFCQAKLIHKIHKDFQLTPCGFGWGRLLLNGSGLPFNRLYRAVNARGE